ncbi:MAG: TRAP transporter substrate-binding protein DctP [Motiliproteus sp.]|nr:TRAP transporter substrate-binding protein DctP [Motiliproteus sp.]
MATSVDYQELIKFSKNVEVMSGGRLQITPHPAGTLAHGPDIFNAVSDGKVQMGNGWPNWWSGQHPSWAVMNAGPFDFMNLDASMMFFFAEGGTELANELSLPKGVIWRPAWWAGMEFGLTSKEPITGLDDLKEKKVRIGPGLPSEVLAEAAGSFSIPLVPEEIRPSLQNGNLDAVEWTTAAGVMDLGLHDLSPYGIVPAIWQPSVLADFLINKKAYDELSPDLQAILETAIRSYTLTTTLIAKTKDIESLKRFKEIGMTLNKWSDKDIARWREASDKIIERYKNRDEFSRRLIEQKQAFKREYDNYYELFGPYE